MSVPLLGHIDDSLPILDRGGRWAQGEALAREYVAELRNYGGGHDDMLFNADLYVARFVSLLGRFDEAESLFDSLFAREAQTSDPRIRARLHLFYGSHLAQLRLFDGAEQHLDAAANLLDDVRQGTSNVNRDDVLSEFIALYKAWGKSERAAEYERLRHEVLRGVGSLGG
jgi:hypothetical protein